MPGGSAGLMYTPRSVVTLIMAAVILEGVARGPAAVAAHGDVQRTLTLVFFVVVAAGLLLVLGVWMPLPFYHALSSAAAVLAVRP